MHCWRGLGFDYPEAAWHWNGAIKQRAPSRTVPRTSFSVCLFERHAQRESHSSQITDRATLRTHPQRSNCFVSQIPFILSQRMEATDSVPGPSCPGFCMINYLYRCSHSNYLPDEGEILIRNALRFSHPSSKQLSTLDGLIEWALPKTPSQTSAVKHTNQKRKKKNLQRASIYINTFGKKEAPIMLSPPTHTPPSPPIGVYCL